MGPVTVIVRPGPVPRYDEDMMNVMEPTAEACTQHARERFMTQRSRQWQSKAANAFNTSGGFTLLELLVGVAIVGIMITVGAPAVTDYLACQRLSATARAVASDLQLSRMQAVSERVTHQVAFATNPPTYTRNRWDVATVSYVPIEPSKAFNLGVDLTSGAATVVFQTYGAAPAGLTVTLDSQECGKQRTVSVNSIGRVKLL